MEQRTIECLNCGAPRLLTAVHSHLHDECHRCGYLGWAESESLTETLRRRLRERPLEHRRPARVAT